jgi:drug/metabolite transporter (DMT)-like permease
MTPSSEPTVLSPPPAKPWAIATLCLALVAVACAPIFIRFSETELGANGTVFNRFLVFVLCFGTARLLGRPAPPKVDGSAPITRAQWLALVGVGVISTVSLVLWALSLQYTTVAKSMLLNNLTPIFTSLGGWLLWRQRFDSRFLIGMAIALTGAITLGLEDLTGTDGLLLGDLYALLSAVFLGLYFLLVEYLRQRFGATTILLWRGTIGVALLLPVVLITEGQLFPTTTVAWLAVVGLGLISEGLGQRLLADCMKQFSAQFISLFLLLEPIISALLAWAIFQEQMGPLTGIGFAVVLIGVYLAQSSPAALQGEVTHPEEAAAPS